MKFAVIGGGLAGLVFGAMAVKDGHKVVIYEKNPVAGGVLALCQVGDYRFEQGPLLMCDLLPGEPMSNLLAQFGIHLDLMRADRNVEMPDYSMHRPEKYEGPYWRRDRLKELFPADARGLDEYYNFYDNMMRVRYNLNRKPSPRSIAALAASFLPVARYSRMTAQQLVEHFFTDRRLQALYTGILADYCADPNEVWGLAVPMTNLETGFDDRIPLEKNGKQYFGGFGYIKGGCQKIAEALSDYIIKNGGVIKLNTVVDKVLIENEKAVGVRLADGTCEKADVVAGSGSGRDFFFKTVGKEHLDSSYRKILETYRPMEAVFMVHAGIDFNPVDVLGTALCYCYGSYDLSEATGRLRSGEYHDGEDGFLLFVPSYHAPEFAPPGRHCLTIYTVAPDTLSESDWETEKEKYADHLLERAERYLPGLRQHITTKKIMTAVDYRKITHMSKSSFGGTVPVWHQKNPPHKTPVKDLWFIGQQSENGGGLWAVSGGAAAAYKECMRKKR
ncbi:MAG: NAD(P)/FAD-dependent oxidoreductase [Clostridia bacterium]|nr:NAD(P)/FAD-dependent oxidoreductase [Clostridia bacterium]